LTIAPSNRKTIACVMTLPVLMTFAPTP
jgi:hypothetical protein